MYWHRHKVRNETGRSMLRQTARLAACGVALAVLGVIDCGTTASAPAKVFIGFQINSVNVDPLFLYDNQGSDSLGDDTLTAGPAEVNLSLKLEDSTEVMFDNADFELNASLSSLSVGGLPGSTIYELLFDGSFSFNEANSGDLIIDATFTDARLLLMEFADSGLVGFASGLAADTNVNYGTGPAWPPGLTITGDEQFQFTVNSLLAQLGGPVHITSVPSPDDVQFENFTFNSSSSGSMAVIPEPASLGLAAFGALALAALRRRRKA